MKKIDIHIGVEFCQLQELNAEDQQLVRAATEATARAYAPYSGFRVGAAVRLANGQVVIGANQENAAYPSGLCAERTAVFAAQAQYPDQPIVALAIAAASQQGVVEQPVTPCGACRQVVLEVEQRYQRPVRILLFGAKGVFVVNSMTDLLPLSFTDDALKG